MASVCLKIPIRDQAADYEGLSLAGCPITSPFSPLLSPSFGMATYFNMVVGRIGNAGSLLLTISLCSAWWRS